MKLPITAQEDVDWSVVAVSNEGCLLAMDTFSWTLSTIAPDTWYNYQPLVYSNEFKLHVTQALGLSKHSQVHSLNQPVIKQWG